MLYIKMYASVASIQVASIQVVSIQVVSIQVVRIKARSRNREESAISLRHTKPRRALKRCAERGAHAPPS